MITLSGSRHAAKVKSDFDCAEVAHNEPGGYFP
jgi:hypothetical protein